MSDHPISEGGRVEAAEPVVKQRRGISIVWLIPIVAVVIGGWLVFRTLSEQGPTITITFDSAAGLEAKKTKIKYKSVDVGQVLSIRISADSEHVVVTADLNKDAEPYLKDETRFWVVKPRLGFGGVSGLETLVSGAFIEIEPGDGKPKFAFKGLEQPPILRTDTPGGKYVLTTPKLGSLSPGSPVYYRDLEVGEVLGYELAKDDKSIQVHVFVKAPHNNLVRDSTRFWNASGLRVSAGADGLKVEMAAVESLLRGGIAFDTPTLAGVPSANGTQFRLYRSLASITEEISSEGIEYVAYFRGSVRGLSRGAPVEFNGINIGAVTDVKIEIDQKTLDIRIPVYFKIDPQRNPSVDGVRSDDPRADIQALIQRGLRAQLQTGSLLTGQLFVDLTFRPDAPPPLLSSSGLVPEFPTVPSTMDEFKATGTELLAKLRKIPFDQIAANLLGTLEGANSLVNSPEVSGSIRGVTSALESLNKLLANFNGELQPTAAEFRKIAAQASTTLSQAQEALSMLKPGSPVRVHLSTTLEQTAAAARSLRQLANYLERRPDALIYGKGKRGN